MPFACLLLCAGQSYAQTIVFGDPPDPGSGNAFPFTTDGFNINTRYQQVYRSADFPGRVCITEISFFDNESPGAVFEEADYSFTLSTSNFPVNSLDLVNLDANPGADAQLFASQHLAGLTGAKFTITAGTGGGTEFDYDPAAGDLLVDIERTNQVVFSGSGNLDARNGTAAGQFSRAHNFDSGFQNYGLKTEFAISVGGCSIDVDIKPGSCPNSFNRQSNGVLPVALVGNPGFDPAQVDLSTVRMSRADAEGGEVGPHEGPPGPHSVLEDAATPFNGELCNCHELTGDGIDDLSMKFNSQEVVAALELNDLPPGALAELCVSGELLDGTEFEGCDCIRLVPPGDMDGDGIVGVVDLLLLLAEWGLCGPTAECSADYNGDAMVGVVDLITMLGNWG